MTSQTASVPIMEGDDLEEDTNDGLAEMTSKKNVDQENVLVLRFF